MECACFPRAKSKRLARPRFNWPTDAPPMSPCMYWKAAKRRSNLSCGRAWPRFSTSIRKSRVRDSVNPATWIMSYTTACIDSSFKDLAPGSARLIDDPPATEASLNSFRVSGKSWSPQSALGRKGEIEAMKHKIKLLAMSAVSAAAFAQTSCDEGAEPLNPAVPKDIRPPEIVRTFSAQETMLKDAQTRYSYTMDVSVQTLDSVTVDGEFRKVSEFSYPGGVRHEKVKFSPVSTLQRITMSKQDFDDIYERTPFVLNQQDITQYNVLYAGQQKVDELETYVFDAAPKQMEPGKRYFKGRVWVETHDLSVVKSCGKNVPDPTAT